MFGNDFGGQYGSHWNVPTFWGGNPYFCGYGSIPQNYFGWNNFPYHNNLNHYGTHNTGWTYGHNVPQTTFSQPFHGYNWGIHHNTNVPYNYHYTPQGYTPFFQNHQVPFQNCR